VARVNHGTVSMIPRWAFDNGNTPANCLRGVHDGLKAAGPPNRETASIWSASVGRSPKHARTVHACHNLGH